MAGGRDPLAAVAQRWGAAGYIVAILATEVVTLLVGYAAWRPDGSEALLQLVVYVLGVAAGVVLWRQCPARAPATGLLRVFLVIALALWAIEAGRRLVVGEALNPVWLALPLLLGLVWGKPPAPGESRTAVTAVAVVVAGAVLIAVVAESLGLTNPWYLVREGFGGMQPYDIAAYWLPLSEPLGIEGRWAGPFAHPNMAGPLGGLLIIVGLWRRGLLRAALVAVGLLILVLTASRTSMVGALLGILAMLAVVTVWDRRRLRRDWWIYGLVLVAVGGFLLLSVGASGQGVPATDVSTIVERGATATGRADMWPTYLSIWLESPWWGSPDARIDLAIASGELPGWATTAHSLLLESLVRLGVMGAALVVALFAVVGVMAARAAAARVPVGIGLAVSVLGGGITDSVVFWRLWALSTIILFLAVVASAGPYPPARWPRPVSSRPEPMSSAAD